MSDPYNPLVPFTPVRLRYRHDGWTPEKQIAFIEALAETACVEAAARRVGMSVASAYALRNRPCARAFRDAWDAALDMGMQRLEQAALSRAINGVARPVFYKGEQVGEWRQHDEKLTMFLLRYRRPQRYGAWRDRLPPLVREDGELCGDDSALRLDLHCEEIGEVDWVEELPEAARDDESPRA